MKGLISVSKLGILTTQTAVALLLLTGRAGGETKLLFQSPGATEASKAPDSSVAGGTDDDQGLNPSVAGAAQSQGEIIYGDAEENTGPTPRVQVIMDGSGSMAEVLEDDKTKM